MLSSYRREINTQDLLSCFPGDAGDSQELISGALTGDDLDLGGRDRQPLREKPLEGLVGLPLDRGSGYPYLHGVSHQSVDPLLGGPGLKIDLEDYCRLCSWCKRSPEDLIVSLLHHVSCRCGILFTSGFRKVYFKVCPLFLFT